LLLRDLQFPADIAEHSLRIPGQVGHLFQSKLATHSDVKLATCSDAMLATFSDIPERVANMSPE
jgi:hypothetical protein